MFFTSANRFQFYMFIIPNIPAKQLPE